MFDVRFPEEGTPCGYGYVDLCKSPQKQIDLMNQAILKNTLAAATPRFFIRSDGAVNENEYADWRCVEETDLDGLGAAGCKQSLYWARYYGRGHTRQFASGFT